MFGCWRGEATTMLTTDHEACSTHCAYRDLTFDMSGGAKGAKRPLGRPLDGGVR